MSLNCEWDFQHFDNSTSGTMNLKNKFNFIFYTCDDNIVKNEEYRRIYLWFYFIKLLAMELLGYIQQMQTAIVKKKKNGIFRKCLKNHDESKTVGGINRKQENPNKYYQNKQ